MAAHWIWWAAGALLVGAELVTGTFYLLAVGVAFALGGVAAWSGAAVPLQLAIAGVLAVGLTLVAHRWRLAHAPAPQQAGLDVGQSVRVQTWRDDGTARVSYRGTQWDAVLASGDTQRADTMYIVGTRGSTLVLSPSHP